MDEEDEGLKRQADELLAAILANVEAHEGVTRQMLIDVATRQVEELAVRMECFSRILNEACRALLEFAKEADAPVVRQWRIYEERFGIWHGEN